MLVAQGEGRKGTSRGYLAGTLAALSAMGGRPEPGLQRLQAAVTTIMRQSGGQTPV